MIERSFYRFYERNKFNRIKLNFVKIVIRHKIHSLCYEHLLSGETNIQTSRLVPQFIARFGTMMVLNF